MAAYLTQEVSFSPMTPPSTHTQQRIFGTRWDSDEWFVGARPESDRAIMNVFLDLYDLQMRDVEFILTVDFKEKPLPARIPFCIHVNFPLYVI